MPNTHETLTSLFSDIADAIRAKTGGTADITADTFPTAIGGIPQGGGVTVRPLEVTANGTYTAQTGTAYSPVTVNVPTGSLPEGFSVIPFSIEETVRQITVDFDDISHVLAVAVMCGRTYIEATQNIILSCSARASASRSWFGTDIYASGTAGSTTIANQQPMVEGNSITIGNNSYGNFIGGATYYIFVYKEAAE